MTWTQISNLLWFLVCALAGLVAETGLLSFLPEDWRHVVTGMALLAAYIKSHWNYKKNPDGSPAQSAWDDSGPSKGTGMGTGIGAGGLK